MPDGQVLILNANNFAETISKGVTLVDFWAVWCAPCRRLDPILERIAAKMSNKAKICKLNIDENPGISVEYNVMSIPAIFIYKDGQVVNQLFGIRSEEELVEAIIGY
ncbi:MAG: thioredoxin [Candidatus Aminicenantes bacterium]|nr:MAG: thioredoxin [Candidatus Aminicenantes bacterium]